MRHKVWNIHKFPGRVKEVLRRKVRYRFSKLPGLSTVNAKCEEVTGTLASIVLRKIRIITGFMLMISGTVGVLLPFIPGTVLLLTGVAMAGSCHPVIKSWIRRMKQWQAGLRNTSKQQTGPVSQTNTLFKADEGVSPYFLLINLLF